MSNITAGMSILLLLAVLLSSVAGLGGSQLYVYTDRTVYTPGSKVLVRVLAVDSDGQPAPGVSVLVLVYSPESAYPDEYEGVTEQDGYLLIELNASVEGTYMVSAEDLEFAFGRGEATFLVCSNCVTEGVEITTTVVTTETTTRYQTIATTVTDTVTETVERTVTSTKVSVERSGVEYLTTTVKETVSTYSYFTVTTTYLSTISSQQTYTDIYLLPVILVIGLSLALLLGSVFITFRRRRGG
ncbi:hypothetical protein HRbin01_01764 [archaeon HR01]|nr:hypothetical protein HRbin01_01764 [archaeon HR01]